MNNNNSNSNDEDKNDAESEMTRITNIHDLRNDTLYGDFNNVQLRDNYKNNNNNYTSNTTTNSSLQNDNKSGNSNNNNDDDNTVTAQSTFPSWDEIASPVWHKRKRSKQSERQLNKSSMSSSLMVVSAETTKVNSPMSVMPSQNLSRSVSQPHLHSIHSLNSS